MEEIIKELEVARADNEKIKIVEIIKKAKDIGIDPPKLLKEVIKRNLQNTLI